MTVEDELRDRLHRAAAGVTTPGDLLPTLAEEHARRHRRARTAHVGGAIAATVLVAALLTGLFTASGPALQVDTADGPAGTIARAQRATSAAGNLIAHLRTEQGGRWWDSWVLRNEKRARVVWPNAYDTTVKPPGTWEQIDYAKRTVSTTTGRDIGDAVTIESGTRTTRIGDPDAWLREPSLAVRATGAEIHLVGTRFGTVFEVWLDSTTYLPVRAVFGGYRMSVEWLPATAENRALLDHTVPPGFTPAQGRSALGQPSPTPR